ncbi:hydroxysteroid dehydrogenase-like protein 2 [Nematostella vectensis]|uniref:hydroxysteroid dehydrogenase-like protein 2 n=1 Tax=Nematostella vectensis TaxID=45351 RepID=UPI0020770CE0|nr:hydroxysteroid dehydrogenase-like protein 2 [Nematostella vectensis]
MKQEGGEVAGLIATIQSNLSEDVVKSINGVFEFKLNGKEPGTWYLDLKNGKGDVGAGSFPKGKPHCTLTLKSEDFVKMFKGELNPTQAFMAGKLKMKGNMMIAMKLEKLMGKFKSKL